MKKIPFFLVTGFLGSGKTTFLRRLIEQYSGSRKLGIIQNEFAPGSVDGTELKNTGKAFEILEVNNGSVFCVCLLGPFVKSLRKFVDEHNPDVVILEASGLSDPISIGEMLQGPELSDRLYLSHIWCFLDASSFRKLAKNLPRVQHQVRVADTVVINKTDLERSNLEEIKSWIGYLNPFASVESTTYSGVPVSLDPVPDGELPVAAKKKGGLFPVAGSGRPDFGAYVIKTTKIISLEKLQAFLREVSPGSLRIKGFVRVEEDRTMVVQSCYGETSMEEAEGYMGPTELIGVGPGINRDNFGRRFMYYQERD